MYGGLNTFKYGPQQSGDIISALALYFDEYGLRALRAVLYMSAIFQNFSALSARFEYVPVFGHIFSHADNAATPV